MAYSQAKADRMNQLAQQYPRAPISTLATLANIPASEISNYTTDTISTPARNANFGRVTSVASTEVQASNTPTTSPGSGSAFAGNTVPQPTVTSPTSSTTARVNPVTGRPFTTPPQPTVTSPTSSTTASVNPVTGRPFTTPPQPTVTSPPSSETVTNTTGSGTAFQGGGTIASQAFRDQTPQTSPYPAPPPPRPVQTQDSDVDFTDAYGENYRQATPIPAPVVESNNTEVDFADDYSENFRTPQPIPVDTRRPGTPPSPYQDDFPDDNVNVTQPTPRPDINAPEPPPARPAQAISQVDDFGGTGITQVDDFGGAPQNVTPVDDFAEYSPPAQVDDFAEFQAPAQVDDFAEYSPPAQVDDFAEINTPAQVDDFGGYSNNDFGAEDPGLDAFGPGPTPPAEPSPYQDDFDAAEAEFFGNQTPEPVDDFGGYSDNDFGAEDPGLDAFGPGPAPAQVDDFADYSDNDFGAEVDDFGEINTPPPVDDFADYSDNDFGAEVDDFADYESPSDINEFGVDDFGDAEAAQFDEFGDPIRAPEDVEDFDEYGDFEDEEGEDFDAFGNRVDNEGNEDDLIVDDDPDGGDIVAEDAATQQALSEQQQSAIQAQALKEKAQQQQTVSEMREASGVKNADGDWRVKLRLAPQATYLYQAQEPGILAPLTETDGIIFPYTPSIDIQYRANYQEYSPTHSNYQHYFYQGSNVAAIQLSATFTAQDTVEAEYLLAVIHFLKSCSKMFYGNDAQRGSPPPLLYLSGLGEYQFNESPCVISEFNYNLPNDVNYIRARSKQIKRDGQLQYKKPLATSVTNGNFSSLARLKTAITNAYNGQSQPLEAAAEPYKPAPGNLGSKGATYVPTKMDITIVLNPIVSRKQVSQQFSLKEYANGNLIKKGMW
jgi:hypothetical protein